jgi:hypothetical protein
MMTEKKGMNFSDEYDKDIPTDTNRTATRMDFFPVSVFPIVFD